MEEQEDRLENLAEQEHDAREDLRKSSEELEEYISGLNF
jgi:predicted enzyme involved in methoxymalonyl-ACP biosynthesis